MLEFKLIFYKILLKNWKLSMTSCIDITGFFFMIVLFKLKHCSEILKVKCVRIKFI